MTGNSELLQKADLALADFSGAGNGGLLNPEQANTFVRKLIQTPTAIRMARIVTMASPQRYINKIQFGKRILRAGTSATALDTAAVDGAFNASTEATARAKPDTSQVQIDTSEVIAEVRIPYDVMEDNIERATAANNEPSNDGPGGLRNTIMTLIAERAALDLEELALLGDESTGVSDPYLDLQDGWIIDGETNGTISDAGGANVTKARFKAGMKSMPDQYLRNIGVMRHMVSTYQEIEWRDSIAERGTSLGDTATTGNRAIPAYGVPVEPVPLMPQAKGIFTNPLNLIMGIHRAVSMESDKDIKTREYIIVLTARVGLAVEEADALVIYNNFGTP